METQSASTPDELERIRLESLASFAVFDTGPEHDFDALVALVARLCDTPIATVTFIGEDRQWFKAKVGTGLEGSPRSIAFCAYAIAGTQHFIIPDTHLDIRFSENPLVLGEPWVRFYAGYPLITSDGSALGTLAVMDRVPRVLQENQLDALRVLARQVVKCLELRRGLMRLSAVAVERNQAWQNLEQARTELEAQVANQASALERALAEHGKAERLYRTLWETTTDAVLILDSSSIIAFANPGTRDIFGYEPGELVGKPLAMLQTERLRVRHDYGMRRFLATGVAHLNWRSVETTAVRKDGVEVSVEIAFSRMHIDGVPLFVGFFRDITERKQTELALFDQKERAQATLRSIGDGVIVIDEEGRVTFMNPLAETLTGWTSEEATGRGHDEILRLMGQKGETAFVQKALGEESDAASPLSIDSMLLEQRDGSTISIEGNVARLRGQAGQAAGSVIAFRDVSHWRRMAAQLSYQATHDSLTGLVNRGEFERRLQSAIEQPLLEREHSMLYLDLDQFKVVNDTSGHVAGDELLRQLSAVLRMHLRNDDTLSRLGGDEFGVLLENCSKDNAVVVAEKLRRAVAEYSFPWREHVFEVGVSIGHVSFRSGEMSLSDILSKSDEACYAAKDLGRNRVHSYQPEDEDVARRHGEMKWLGLIRKALKEDRFVLFAQEIFDLRDGAVKFSSHEEVLLRMRDEDGGLVPPMAFIPAAERYNLMPALDRWVIRNVCEHVGRRIKVNPVSRDCCVAINLSGSSVTDPLLCDFIREQLESNSVPGSCICFEITETAAIGNLAHAVRLICDVKALGCSFALDDFGSGMSSFGYLKHLPVDILKIDGSFVRDIADDPIDRAMVAAINEIGHLMGLSTVAEFVEDDRILAELRAIGVDYGQGYGLARPRPLR